MSVLLLLIAASLGIAVGFLAAFVWAVRSGQYEDTCTPSMRVLTEDLDQSVSSGLRPSGEAGANKMEPDCGKGRVAASGAGCSDVST